MKIPVKGLVAATAGAMLVAMGTGDAAKAVNLIGGGAEWQRFELIFERRADFFGLVDANLSVYDHFYFDAFDGALRLAVGSNIFNPSGFTHSGQFVTTDSIFIGSLEVIAQYFADPNSPTLRTLFTFNNLGAFPLSVPVDIQTNLGSDETTQVISTSSGDSVFNANDRWVITDDFSTTDWDPTNTTVLAGLGRLPDSVSQTIFRATGSEGIRADYTITLGAGETSSLLFFNVLNPTSTAALNNVRIFNNYDAIRNAGLLTGLSDAQLINVSNFDFQTNQSVPEPASVLGLLAVGSLAVGSGLKRKQKQKA
jgi:hypothetical protein